MRALALILLASCTGGGGEGNGDIDGTVQLGSLSCERRDSKTVVVRGEASVFMRETLAFRVSSLSPSFPLDGGLVQSSVLACGEWLTPTGCVREPGDPHRETIQFTSTTELDSELPPSVSVTLEAIVTTPDTAQVFAEDVRDVVCP